MGHLQELVRGRGLCGELLFGGEHICVRPAGDGHDHDGEILDDPPWGDQICTAVPEDGPTAQQIKFAKWVIWHIKGAPPDAQYWYDSPAMWEGLKDFLRWAAREAEKEGRVCGDAPTQTGNGS